MPRPIQCWYLSTRDIVRYCDLTAHSVNALNEAGKLVKDDLASLLIFSAKHLKPTYRKSLKQTLALGKFHYVREEEIGKWDYMKEPDISLTWTVNSKIVSMALGITQNSWHVAISRSLVDPADLFSMVRFACLYARPDIRGTIIGAIASVED
jgi:hypothetical protein